MDALFRFLVQYEVLVYLVLTIGALFAGRSLWAAWSEWRIAVFGLEKELTFQKVRVSGAVFLLLIMIGLSMFCLVTFIVPFLPSTALRPTPTANLLATPVVTLSASDLTAEVSFTATPTGTSGCVTDKLTFSSPKPGDNVKGKIVLSGTINMANFGFYKYEYAAQGTDTWTTIAAGDKTITNGELGAWDASQLTPGDYQLRLLVTDNLGKALTPCVMTVHVVAP